MTQYWIDFYFFFCNIQKNVPIDKLESFNLIALMDHYFYCKPRILHFGAYGGGGKGWLLHPSGEFHVITYYYEAKSLSNH